MMQLRLAVRNLRRNTRRSTVLILTVAMGVAALFMLDGFNFGIMNQYKDNTIHFKTGHGQLNTVGYRDQVYEKPWEHWIEYTDALSSELQQLPGVAYLFPRVDFYTVVTNGTVSIAAKGSGIDAENEDKFFWAGNIVEGKNLTTEPDGMLLGVGLARALSVKVGSRLTLLTNTIYGSYNGVDVKVVGIFHSGMKDVDDSYFRIPRTLASQLLDTNKVESIVLGLTEDDMWDTFAKSVGEKFAHLTATPFAVLDEVYYQHSVDWLGQQFLVILVIIVTIVMLGITNTISFTVLERSQEIGNLRANGESAFEVLGLLLWEGLVIGLVGAVFGVLLSYAANTLLIPQGILMPPAPGITRQFHVKVELRAYWALVASGLGVMVALVATFIAGWRQVRSPISQLLRQR